ncbi:phage major capsid protein [Parasedimentitalea psychrophila]|uniref:Phage major capsid protein n=1 Tax=Parasedimentitalea psychrophila TaxID=2997337 RepID=A0A9Y2KYU9_9RHOB|nr:phage major capsid protein [Parasedimentitalea psychrophila]WIY24820.1 phage major capsid protein [Parasedimentitalea psychrophila]
MSIYYPPTKHRGIQLVQASIDNTSPVAILADLNRAFEEFKAKRNEEISVLHDAIGDINSQIAGYQVGGAGPIKPNSKDISNALRSFVRDGDSTPLSDLAQRAQASMSVDSDPGGGYSVIPQLGENMNKRVHEISPMRQLARVVTISTDVYEELNDLDEAGGGWVGEREARPDTDNPNLGKLIIPIHEIFAMPKVTQKLLDDTIIDIAAWITEKCAELFARKEGSAFITGDGILKPRGLLTYPTDAQDDEARDWGTIQHLNTGTSGSFGTTSDGVDTLIDATYAIKSAYRQNASWLMNRKAAAVVRKMKDADGNLIWSQGLAAGQPDRLLGFPVMLDEEMPDMASNSLSIAFGDFDKAYLIVDRHGLRLLRDQYTDKPNVRFYTYKRVGGGVGNFEAIKFVRFST